MALTHAQRHELRSIIEQRGVALRAEMSRGMSALQELEVARKRMAYGTYGLCAECGCEIEYARLRSDPCAEHCAACEFSPARPPLRAGA